jgi:hypothetical protein
MRGIFVNSGKEPFEIQFEDTLENLQSLVDGRIEVFSIHYDEEKERSIDLIFNEEGKFLYSEVNKYLVFSTGYVDDIRGPIICIAADETTGEFDSLTDEEMEIYLTMLKDDKLFFY